MGYYTRVLSKRADAPTLDELQSALQKERAKVTLTVEDGDASEWRSLILRHDDGLEIAEIERNAVAPDGQIEAVSMPEAKGFMLGVQWHPEWRWAEDELSVAIFSAFGEALKESGR